MRAAAAFAAASAWWSSFSRWRLRCSTFFRLAGVARTASFRGSRKFRAYPLATSRVSPRCPSAGTSVIRMTFMAVLS